jgi:hypothetical protein
MARPSRNAEANNGLVDSPESSRIAQFILEEAQSLSDFMTRSAPAAYIGCR